jgi:hypothetical protein
MPLESLQLICLGTSTLHLFRSLLLVDRVDGLLLYQPGLGLGEFQAWLVTAQPGQKAIDMVSCTACCCRLLADLRLLP